MADTLYYQMRIHQVGVYFLDAQGKPLGVGPVQVWITKAGASYYFFDKNMSLRAFTHTPVRYGAGMFTYNAASGCPMSADTCGDLCPDYIRYSPFGDWNVTIFSADRQGVNLSKLSALRFEFQVEYQAQPGFNPNIFGKKPPLYPQNLGRLCKSGDVNTTELLDPDRRTKTESA